MLNTTHYISHGLSFKFIYGYKKIKSKFPAYNVGVRLPAGTK